MNLRALETLAWLDLHAALVAAHPGAAFAETEILRMMVTQTGPIEGDVLAVAYQRDLARGVPAISNRAEARALAHAVMFASNFGREPLIVSEGFTVLLETLIVEYVDDIDTLGELLIVAAILALGSDTVTVARDVFDAAWGSLDRGEFAQNYHAILVGGLLYAMS